MESKQELQSVKRDLEDALLEQHRLEDELELRRQEIEQKDIEIRESAKLKLESEKLANNEVCGIFCGNLTYVATTSTRGQSSDNEVEQ